MSMGSCHVCGQYCNQLSEGRSWCHDCRRAEKFAPKEQTRTVVREITVEPEAIRLAEGIKQIADRAGDAFYGEPNYLYLKELAEGLLKELTKCGK